MRESATFLLFSTRYAFPSVLLPRSPLNPHGSPGSLPPFYTCLLLIRNEGIVHFFSHSFHFISPFIPSFYSLASTLPYFSIIHEYATLLIHASCLTRCVSNPPIRKVKKSIFISILTSIIYSPMAVPSCKEKNSAASSEGYCARR